MNGVTMNKSNFLRIGIVGILILLILGGTQAPVNARTGGPETSGYVFIDSDEPGGPAYALEDIAGSGTAVSLGDNAISGLIPIGFTFNFFGVDYTGLYASSNGFVTFLSGQPNAAAAQAIPASAGPNAVIAGWWGDLKPNYGGSITYKLMGSAPNRYFLIQYKDIPYALLSTSKVSFEIKLYETSNAIEVHYAGAPVNADSNGNPYPNTAGIENETGLLGLQYYNGVEGLASSLAVRYTPFVGVALEPAEVIGYAAPGETKTFTFGVYNWTGQADTFTLSLTPTHADWTARILPADSAAIEQGAGADFTVEVDFPADAAVADYFAFDLTVTSLTPIPGTSDYWTDTSPVIAAVPRTGYVFNQNQVNLVDTQFHQDLGNPIDTTVYGQFLLSGGLSQDGSRLFGLLAGAQDDQGGVLTGRVLIFDTADMSAPPDMLDVGNDASFIAQTPDGNYALVSSYGDGTVMVLDINPAHLSYLSVVKTLTVGTQPIRIAVSPCLNKAYVTNRGGNSVSVIDLSTLTGETTAVKTITGFNAPWGIQIAPTGDKAYVVNGGNGRIAVINTITDTLTTTWNVNGTDLQDADLSPDGSLLYTAGSANVLAILTSNGTVTATVANEASGLYSVDVFPAAFGPRAYISNGGVQTISVLDTSSNTLIDSIPMPGAPSFTALFTPATACPYAPIAAFSPTNAVGQLNVPFTFTNLSIRNPASVEWNFGDGATSTDFTPTHTYTAPGTYTVTLRAWNDFGESNTASGTINFKPKAAFTPAEAVINQGDTVSFTSTSTGNPTLTYRWTFGDGATSTAQNPTHTYTTIGNYTVTLTVTNSYGSDSATGTVVFLPKAAFTPLDNIIQLGDTINFTSASTGSTPLTLAWDFGDGTTSDQPSVSHTYTEAKTYTVKLTATNPWGSSEATTSVNFKPKSIFTPTLSKIRAGDSVTFTNSSTGNAPLTYTWNFGDGAASSDPNPTHTYTAVGDYTVSLKVDNAYGSDTATGKVVFPPVAGFTQSATVIQTGGSVSFTNTSTGTATMTYLWEFGDGSTSTQASPTHQYTTAGAYTVRLTATNDYGSSQATGQVNFRPKAGFTPASSVIKTGDTINFSSTSTGTAPLSYAWEFGDGGTSDQPNPSHTYTAAGSYTVRLTVTNAYGSETATGTVNFAPKAAFTPVNKVIQLGASITYTNNTTGTAPLSYEWDFGDGTTSTLAGPSHTYTTAGSYTVKLKVTNAYGSETATGTVNFSPKAAFSPLSSVIKTGDTLNFTNNSTGTAPLSYEWNFGDGGTSTQANPSHTYTAAGSYTVSLKVTNAYGSETVTGSVNFAPRAAFTPASKVIQLGQAVAFSNTSTGTAPLSYQWDFGDGTSSTQASPSHTYTAAGSYTVKMTVTNAYGSEMATGTVNFSPKAAFSPVNQVIQLGDGINYTNNSTGTAPLSYEWSFGDGTTSTLASPSHTYTAAGSYTVTLKVTNAYGSETASGTVNFAPKASFTPQNKVIQLGEAIGFTSTSTGTAPLTYLWNFGDGSTSTLANPSHTYTSAGSYTVSLKVTNAYGNETVTGSVNFKPKAGFIFSPTANIKPGQELTFTNQSTGTSPMTCTWNFGDGTPATTTWNPKHAFSARGVYAVRLSCHNDSFGDDSIQKNVEVAPFHVNLAFVNNDGVESIQAGQPVTIWVTVSNSGPDDLISARADDLFSPFLSDITWTCTASAGSACPTGGSGSHMSDTVSILKGGSLSYVITAFVRQGSVGHLEHLFSIVLPSDYVNDNPAGESSIHLTDVWQLNYLPLVFQ